MHEGAKGGAGEMRLGIFAWFGVPLPFGERMRLAQACGFNEVSLWWPSQDPMKRDFVLRLPSLVRDAGLSVSDIHVPFDQTNDIWSSDAGLCDRALAVHVGWLEECREVGIPCMVMHVLRGMPEAVDVDKGLANFQVLARCAEEYGVKLALENTRRNDILSMVLEYTPSRNVGLCYDISHDWLHGENPGRLLGQWGERLLRVHVNDTRGKRDDHRIPGDGAIDYSIMAAWRGWRKWPGVLTLEACISKDEAVTEFLGRGYGALAAVGRDLVNAGRPTTYTQDSGLTWNFS